MNAFAIALMPGRAHLEAGRYSEAHQSFEATCRATQGAHRSFAKALVWWTEALAHHQRGNLADAEAVLAKAWKTVTAKETELNSGLANALLETWSAVRQGAPPCAVWPLAAQSEVSEMTLEARASCPSCGEPVLVAVAPEDAADSSYVEDCPVCCRPWRVDVHASDGGLEVRLERS